MNMLQGNTVAIENWVVIEQIIKIVLSTPLNDEVKDALGAKPSYSILKMFDSKIWKKIFFPFNFR